MLGFTRTGSGPVLVFLHGALVSRSMWAQQVTAFQQTHTVLCIDLPAHGESAGLPPRSVEGMAVKVLETLDALHIGSFTLCGHSLGGMVAQEIALRSPGRVRGLILAESSFGTSASFFERMGTNATRRILQNMTQKQLVTTSANSYGKENEAVRRYITEEMSVYTIETSRMVITASLNYTSRDRLWILSCPTLILAAEKNRQTHRQAKEFVRLIQNATLVMIPKARHMLNMDNPAAFNAAVEQFLKKHTL